MKKNRNCHIFDKSSFFNSNVKKINQTKQKSVNREGKVGGKFQARFSYVNKRCYLQMRERKEQAIDKEMRKKI